MKKRQPAQLTELGGLVMLSVPWDHLTYTESWHKTHNKSRIWIKMRFTQRMIRVYRKFTASEWSLLLTANLFLVPSPCSAIFVPCVFLRQAAGWQIWTHSAVLPAAAIAQSGELLSHGEFIWPKKGMISWYMGYVIYSSMIHIHTYIYIYVYLSVCVVWFITVVQIYIYICIYNIIQHYITLYTII